MRSEAVSSTRDFVDPASGFALKRPSHLLNIPAPAELPLYKIRHHRELLRGKEYRRRRNALQFATAACQQP